MKYFMQKYYPMVIVGSLCIAGIFFVVLRENSKIIENVSSSNGDSVSFANPSKINVHRDVKNQLRELEIAVEKNPKNVSHLIMLATFLMDAHKQKEAIFYFERAIVLDPKNISTMLDLTVCYAQNKEYEKALATTDRLLKVQPKSSTGLYNKGALLATRGKTAEAIKVWKKIIVLAPNSNEAKKAIEGIYALGGR